MSDYYIECQDQCGIEVGDRVMVTRTAKNFEKGWRNTWISLMDTFVGGEVLTVIRIDDDRGIRVKSDMGTEFHFPYFVLKKIGGDGISELTVKQLMEKKTAIESEISTAAGKVVNKFIGETGVEVDSVFLSIRSLKEFGVKAQGSVVVSCEISIRL